MPLELSVNFPNCPSKVCSVPDVVPPISLRESVSPSASAVAIAPITADVDPSLLSVTLPAYVSEVSSSSGGRIPLEGVELGLIAVAVMLLVGA